MNTSQYTFRQLLSGGMDATGQDTPIRRINIPKIQRDYAQGRKNEEADRIRKDFLQALYDAVSTPGASATLDFVYGTVADETLTPLDGQQRLTTLYLLYWYAGMKEKIPSEERTFLKQFSYETRHSARDFCKNLTAESSLEKMPSSGQKLSEALTDQHWFLPEWEKDPTVASMLVMLNDIHQKFCDVPGLWEKLDKISFYFLSMDDMGLTDELYIKMNSRGIPLTDFEHFKAQLSKQLKTYNLKTEEKILAKIDIKWTDMLWAYRSNDIIDEEFLCYFKFICDVIYYEEYGTEGAPENRIYNEFDLLQRYFTQDCARFKDHITRLEEYFDCWCDLEKDGEKISPIEMVNNYISKQHEKDKIMDGEKKNIFTQCLEGYADKDERKYNLNRFLLLYAFVQFLLHRKKKEEIQIHFPRRLRIVNNLILNSTNEIRDEGNRKSRIPTMMKQIERIITEGEIYPETDNPETGFNAYQMEEEKAKLDWTRSHTEKECEALFALEDHKLLYGQVGILCRRNEKYDLDHTELFPLFTELFEEDWDRVDRALMSIGFYGQLEYNNWRYQFGTKNPKITDPWQSLFHHSFNRDSSDTQKVLLSLLQSLLQKSGHPTKEVLDGIVNEFLQTCDKEKKYCWRYYYVQYDVFRDGFYGKYKTNRDPGEDNNYLIYVMTTRYRESAFSYMPYLKDVCNKLGGTITRNEWKKDDQVISCYEKGYKINGKPIEDLKIEQDETGIDKEDRIKKLIAYFSKSPVSPLT